MKRARILFFASALLLAAGAAVAPAQDQATTAPSQATRRPKIGLALGGGGARGAAHVGVLRVLEQLHIPIDYIAGTSMGSVVGGLYAVGYSPDELEKIISTVDWNNLFIDSAPRRDTVFRFKENEYLVPPGATVGIAHGVTLPAGLIAGRKLGFLLNTLTLPAASVQNFDRLSIPFRAVATDARTGEVVVLGHGSLPSAIRSSMAIPVVFTPVTFEGRSLIDGGTSQNLPVQTVRAMGADIVIAVDVASSSEVPTEGPRSVADMLGRLIDLPLLRNTIESRPLADIVITPDLKGLSSGDFAKAVQIIPKGDAAAKAASEKLSKWSASPEEYAAWQRAHRKPLPKERPLLDAVVVDPIPGFDTRRITRVIATKAGLPFNERVLQADMRRISGMSLWQNVEFRLETTEDGKNTLHIIATPKSWGPTYISAGLDFEINASRADADWNLSMLVDATELNRIGADWKTGLRLGTDIGLASKFYQPLDYTARFFVAPTLFFDQQKIDVFANEVDVASYRVRQGYGGLDLGLQLGHLLSLGQFSVGVDRGIQKAHRIVGLEEFPDVDADTGGFHSELILDQLDNFWFPREGWFVDLAYEGNRTSFGADTDFNRAQLLLVGAHSIGRWVVTGRIGYGDSFGSPLPLGSLFSLGGFRNLSGRPKGQLIGSTQAIGVLTLRYRLTPLPGTIVKGLYVGATAELGNVWATRKDASIDNMHGAWSVFLTTDTLLGPLYLAYGNSGNKNTAIYLFLNRGF
jgi:NTE family protein